MSGATPNGTHIPQGGFARSPAGGNKISCDFPGGCTYSYDGNMDTMRGQSGLSSSGSSAGPPSWLWWLLPVGGLGALGVGIYMSMSNSSTRSGSNQSSESAAPMPPTIEQGGRRVSRARRKHHSKNKTRRA